MNDGRDLRVQYVALGAIGAFMAAITVLYWLTGDENAGVVMMALTAALAFTIAGYLWFQDRAMQDAERPLEEADELYLPHESVWPFFIGLGGFFLANGLILGVWFVLPGVLVLLVGLIGHLRQSRLRT